MWDGEGNDLGDALVIKQNLVNFARRNFFPTAVNYFLQATGKRQIALVIQAALVSGAEPAVGIRGGIRRLIIEIARGHIFTLNHHFANFPDGEMYTLLIHNRNLWPSGQTYGARLLSAP